MGVPSQVTVHNDSERCYITSRSGGHSRRQETGDNDHGNPIAMTTIITTTTMMTTMIMTMTMTITTA